MGDPEENEMGWDFYCDPKHGRAAVIADLKRGWEGVEVIDCAVVGGEVWRVLQVKDADGTVRRCIARDLIRGGGKGSGWGVKGMPHCEGYGVPQRLLDLAPVEDVMPRGYAHYDRAVAEEIQWRAQVVVERAKAAERAAWIKGLKAGDLVVVYGRVYQLLEPRIGKPGWIGIRNGMRYRITKDMQPAVPAAAAAA